ncbi:hypothetical protein A3F29_01590 [Candidatus Roizmanbacteria bacterium RIFCSPHIGHO2_12_FULL_33_9]|uniref:POTRA domain-containing protein n=1 Tax=Candidatus Roizmanbacteria bacterium RIFCSPHIGHO2_12_FULL_33_9 TaxID=1802045 RepID=A0A1F7HKU9_9BACT|nr:MAG: hypothetical protein A3F29_01590 [Candidatus Roizmanbacteria bacterium RIFCSPHIGHO2_12_FULL_33_9]
MQQRKSQRKYSIFKLFAVFASLIFFFLALIYYLYTFFKINNVNIISENKDYRFKGIELVENKNLVLLNTKKLSISLKALNPSTTKVEINKRFPNSVSIKYELKEPIAYLKVNDGYFYLSENSKILYKTKQFQQTGSIIEMHYYQSFDYLTNPVGSSLDFLDINYSLSFLRKVKGLGFEAKSIDIDSPSMIRLNLNDATVIITVEKDIDSQLNNLERIIKQFKVEGNSFSLLDLRFDKPIIKLN